jgi:uncharacterized membrane protein YbhN (UPF0104 family)
LLLISLRLVQLLRIFRSRVEFWRTFRINMQALFYFLAVPTSAGMEAVRFARLRTLAANATGAEIASTLVLDRVIGAVAALVVFAMSGIFVVARPHGTFSLNLATVAALVTVCAALPIALFLSRRLRELASELAATMARSVQQLAAIVALGIGIQVISVLAVHLGAVALGANLPLAATAWGVMGGTVIMVIPLSFAGLGPAEIGAAGLLLAIGVEPGSAAVVVIIAYLGRVIGGLQGAVFEILESGANLGVLISGS